MELMSVETILRSLYEYGVLKILLRIYPEGVVNLANTLEIYCFQGPFYKVLRRFEKTPLKSGYEVVLPNTYHYVGTLQVMVRLSGGGNIPTTSNRKTAYWGKRLFVSFLSTY